MKKISIFLMFITLLIQGALCYAGSASGGGVSDNAGISRCPAITINDSSNPIVAWNDGSEIYLKQWNGSSWEELGNSASGGGISDTSSGSSVYPSLAINGSSNPVVTWGDFSTGIMQTYVRQWNGSSWEEMGPNSASGGGVSNSTGTSEYPSIAINYSGYPVVTWADNDSGGWEIYIKQWNGSIWEVIGPSSASGGGISNNSGMSYHSSVAINYLGNPVVTWNDNTPGNAEIYIRQWNGSSWEEMGPNSASGAGISNNGGVSYVPSIAINNLGNPVVAWEDDTSGDYEIYIRQWNGSSWEEIGTNSASEGGISDNTGKSWEPSIAIDDLDNIVVAWQDDTSGDDEIYIKQWNGLSWEEMGANSASGGGISDNTGISKYPSITINYTANIVLAWQHDTSGDDEIYVKYWTGFVWDEFFEPLVPTKLLNTADPVTILADGVSTSLITTVVADSSDQTVYTAMNTITFNITGEGTLLGSTIKSAVGGTATITLQSTITAGMATVTATSDGLVQDSIDVMIVMPGSPMKLISSAEPRYLKADGTSTSLITTFIVDEVDQQVDTATNPVTFSLTGEGTLLGSTMKNAVGGIVTIELQSTITTGYALIDSISAGLTSANTSVYFGTGIPAYLYMGAFNEVIWADGVSTTMIGAVITDELTLGIIATNEITFSLSGPGSLIGTTVKNAFYDTQYQYGISLATITLRSSLTPGTAIISASSPGLVMHPMLPDPASVEMMSPDSADTIDDYNEILINNEFIDSGIGQGWQGDDESYLLMLPFHFNYQVGFDSVYVCTNGFLDFTNSMASNNNTLDEMKTRIMIAPLWSDLITDGTAQQDEDIYIHQPSADSICFRWCGETFNEGEPVNFEVILYENGDIKFNYGSGNANISPTVGISYGTGEDYLISAHYNDYDLSYAQTAYMVKGIAGVKPDLKIMGIELITPLGNLVPGTQAEAEITVKNTGGGDATANFWVDFYFVSENEESPYPGMPGDYSKEIPYLFAGSSTTGTAYFTYEGGNFSMYAQVDAENRIDESNENNNIYDAGSVTVSNDMGMISGKVYSDLDNGGIRNAGVSLTDPGPAGQTVTDFLGNYSINVGPGVYDITVMVASGDYDIGTVTGVVVGLGQSVSQDIKMSPAGDYGIITGRLVQSDGVTPLPGIMVGALDAGGPAVPLDTIVSDTMGFFRLFVEKTIIGTQYLFELQNSDFILAVPIPPIQVDLIQGESVFNIGDIVLSLLVTDRPEPVDGLYPTLLANRIVRLDWLESLSDDVSGYRIYCSSGNEVDYNLLYSNANNIPPDQTYWESPVLDRGKMYYFSVRPVNALGDENLDNNMVINVVVSDNPGELKAMIKDPRTGRKVSGGNLSIIADIVIGDHTDVNRVKFEYKPCYLNKWEAISDEPDTEWPYFAIWDISDDNLFPNGNYDVRAVAYNSMGNADPQPATIMITKNTVDYDIKENVLIEQGQEWHVKEERVYSKRDNTIRSGVSRADKLTVVRVPEGALDDDEHPDAMLVIRTNDEGAEASSVAGIKKSFSTTMPVMGPLASLSSLNEYRDVYFVGIPQFTCTTGNELEITIPYFDSDNDGRVDGMGETQEDDIQIWSYSGEEGPWQNEEGNFDINTESNTVVVKTTHLSIFALYGSTLGENLDNAYAFPSPFRSDEHNNITFANLTGKECTIKVYNIAGELVFKKGDISKPFCTWDVVNNDGEKIASGVYIYYITDTDGNIKKEKFAVIR